MKKFTKVMLIIAAVFVAVGIGTFSAGVAMGAASTDVQASAENFRTSALYRMGHRLFHWDDGDWDAHWEEDDDWAEDWDDNWEDMEAAVESEAEMTLEDLEEARAIYREDGEQSLSWFEDVEKLDIELQYGDLCFLEAEEDRVQVEILGDANGRIRVNQEGTELKIKGGKRKELENFQVLVYLPAGKELREADIQVNAGMIQADELYAKELDVEVDVGTCDVLYAEAAKSDWKVGTGTLRIAELDGEEIDLCCGAGTLDVSLLGSREDFSYKLECGAGVISIGGDTYSGLAGEQKVNHSGSTKKLEAECGLGEINVDFY